MKVEYVKPKGYRWVKVGERFTGDDKMMDSGDWINLDEAFNGTAAGCECHLTKTYIRKIKRKKP